MTPEQLEGYLHRLNLRFSLQGEEGPDGTFLLGFRTRRYRSLLPPNKKSVKIILSIRNEGEFLTLVAPFLYRAGDAADRAALYECLLDINYTIQGTHFEVDRRDGEIRCATSIPIRDSNLSIAAFEKLLYAIPAIVDHYDARIRKCLLGTSGGSQAPGSPTPAPHAGTAALLEATRRLAKVLELLAGHRLGQESDGQPGLGGFPGRSRQNGQGAGGEVDAE